MAVREASLKNLNPHKLQSEKFISNAPLAKKQLHVSVEQPIQDILDSMSAKERLTFIRRAIGEALVREGLLKVEVESNGDSNRE